MKGGKRTLAGRYRLERELGADASGTVFLAKDLSSGAKVSVKELAAGLIADSAYMARLSASAAALTSFDDPNFVSVLEVIEADDRAYVVSVYVEGQTLRELMGAAPIPPADALECRPPP
jgi:serine/threonine protein kinase